MIYFADKKHLKELYESYLERSISQGKSRAAVCNFRSPVGRFIQYMNERGLNEPTQITEVIVQDFQKWLFTERNLTYRSVATYIRELSLFFDYLVQMRQLPKNILKNMTVMTQPVIKTKQQSHYYTFEEIETRYLNHQKKWVSYGYLNQERKHIKGIIKFLQSNEYKSVYTVTDKTLLQFREYLWNEFVNNRKDGLVVRSQIERLRCLVRLFNYLQKEGILAENPATRIDWRTYYKEIKQKSKNLSKLPQENNDLTQFDQYKIEFIKYELTKGKSQSTVNQYQKAVEIFYTYIEEGGITNLAQVNKQQVLRYHYFLNSYVNSRGNLLTNAHKNKLIWAVKSFFKFLVMFDYLSKDPSLDLEAVREERGLPRDYMNEKEIVKILEQPSLSNDPLSIRDKAVLEVLFSTGIRNNELCMLNIEDVDFHTGMIRINKPKGGANNQRIIPIGQIALQSINKYLSESRPVIDNGDPRAMFLSYRGHRVDTEAILNIVKKYSHQCGFQKNITPHSFRVTCGTMMLKNRADIRYVQEQLGHKRITSTQIYTRLVPVDLKDIHRKCHPREKN